MKESLDQRRARFAWEKVQEKKGNKEYAGLAKGAPALIMQSGLMPILAFLNEKGKKDSGKTHRDLQDHICEWLHKQFGTRISDKQFPSVMTALMGNANGDATAHAYFYQHATEEVMAILRWIRQFAAAVAGGDEGGKGNG